MLLVGSFRCLLVAEEKNVTVRQEVEEHARVQWKTLTDAGCSAQYWSEESGRWEKKAEK